MDSIRMLEEVNGLRKKSLYKPLKKLQDLEILKEYTIKAVRQVTTRFGRRIVVELEDFQIFLPASFAQMSDQAFRELNTGGPYVLIYQGSSNIVFST